MIDPAELTRELTEGFDRMRSETRVVTVFGSSRFGEGHQYYTLTRAVGKKLAELGYTVLTGGGPGLMEAANRGAKDGGGRSLGCTIRKVIGPERDPNGNAWCDEAIAFDTFSARKAVMIYHSSAFVVMPGGFGTMDELYEVLTLRQTRKVPNLPIILVGKTYWAPTISMLQQTAIDEAIDSHDVTNITLTDDPNTLATTLLEPHPGVLEPA